VSLRCAPGRAARALRHDTTVPKCAEPPAQRSTILLCSFAPGSRPCGRASLTQRRPSPGPSPRKLPRGEGRTATASGADGSARGGSARQVLLSAPNSPPLREGRAGRGPGGGAPAGAVRCPSPSPIPSVTQPLPRSWGRGRRPLRGTNKRPAGERAPAGAARCRSPSLPRRQPQPHPGFFGGGGRGLRARWGRCGRASNHAGEPRVQFSPSPRGTRGEGAGGRGPPRAQCDAHRRASHGRQPQPPPGFFGGGGRGLRARWGRCGRAPNHAGEPRVQFSPSPRGTRGEGAGGRGTRGRSVMPFAEPPSVGNLGATRGNPSATWGRGPKRKPPLPRNRGRGGRHRPGGAGCEDYSSCV
jgi:hypothetical protein